jgi:hypothetical protein
VEEVCAVVMTVRVAVEGFAWSITLDGDSEQVGAVPPLDDAANAQLNCTVPEKPRVEATVIAPVPVAPGAKVIALEGPVSVNPCCTWRDVD